MPEDKSRMTAHGVAMAGKAALAVVATAIAGLLVFIGPARPAAEASIPPLPPSISKPAFDGQQLDGANVQLQAQLFADPDAADEHVCTGWEIWSSRRNRSNSCGPQCACMVPPGCTPAQRRALRGLPGRRGRAAAGQQPRSPQPASLVLGGSRDTVEPVHDTYVHYRCGSSNRCPQLKKDRRVPAGPLRWSGCTSS